LEGRGAKYTKYNKIKNLFRKLQGARLLPREAKPPGSFLVAGLS